MSGSHPHNEAEACSSLDDRHFCFVNLPAAASKALVLSSIPEMPAPLNTLLIDGSFEELSEELAQYIDDIRKRQGEDNSNLRGEIAPLLEKEQQDDVLKKLVSSSAALNAAPEKGKHIS